ncbi:MAG: tripartite tricarboxylate transporter permease, partial [Nanoarchaeota archaeon]|nr:tripartite tricarboxylate transporter permease [Nanoarchaeota archaeon]
MIIQIFLFVILGILAGTFTGLIPGIHINLVGVSMVSLSASILASINPIYLAVFIVSMAITHTFVDFIPSVFLGCPDSDTILSVLPGHELLKRGEGHQAVTLTCYGGLAAIIILILIAFPSILIISKTYNAIRTIIPYLLIIVSILLISIERNKFSALVVFLLSGFLGWCVLNISSLKEPLLPMLTGLFGSSMLILSIKNKTKITKQEITKPKTKIFKPLIGALIASPLCSFLPGLGSGQAAIIGNTISRTDKKGFLVLLGATNTLVMGFSFISLYAISKTRTGAAAAIKDIVQKISPEILIIILTTVLISGIISFFLTQLLSKLIIKRVEKVNYSLLSIITLIILTAIV